MKFSVFGLLTVQYMRYSKEDIIHSMLFSRAWLNPGGTLKPAAGGGPPGKPPGGG